MTAWSYVFITTLYLGLEVLCSWASTFKLFISSGKKSRTFGRWYRYPGTNSKFALKIGRFPGDQNLAGFVAGRILLRPHQPLERSVIFCWGWILIFLRLKWSKVCGKYVFSVKNELKPPSRYSGSQFIFDEIPPFNWLLEDWRQCQNLQFLIMSNLMQFPLRHKIGRSSKESPSISGT